MFFNPRFSKAAQVAACVLAFCTAATKARADEPVSLTHFVGLERKPPPMQLAYGTSPSQSIDVYLPDGNGPHPLVVLIHGGCWSRTTAGRAQMRHLGPELARSGLAVWSIGYRRADESGGGYPGTYADVADALDLLKQYAGKYRLDLQRSIVVGHSAGGHLALWAASRRGLSSSSPLYRPAPFLASSTIALAGIGDLKSFSPVIPVICGQGIVDALAPRNAAGDAVYTEVSPVEMGRPDGSIVLVNGVLDRLVPPYVAYDYAMRMRQLGFADVHTEFVMGAGHFDLVTPGTNAWTVVRARISAALAR